METQNRWHGVERPYNIEQVRKLQGSFVEEHSLARLTSEKLWERLNDKPYVHALGAVTGNQAMQMAKAGLPAIYCSGWQVAADNNDSMQMYPDQSLYAVNSVPNLVRRINNCLRRADQIQWMEVKSGGKFTTDYWVPIVADAEAGFGGPLNAFELTKAMIEAGAAGIHFEDQLSSAKKCGHLGGKVLIPASHFVKTLVAARLASDVCNVPTVIIARTDADSAKLLTSDIDPLDQPFIKTKYESPTGDDPDKFGKMVQCRTSEGFYEITGGIEMAIARGLAYAPYADLIWCETSTPNLEEAEHFAKGIHAKYPGKLLAYNCSPSFRWKKHLNEKQIFEFQRNLGAMGYKFQFITLAGFHALNQSMFDLAFEYKHRNMEAYVDLQEKEFDLQQSGYTAVKHQREVGVGYFDMVMETIGSNLTALKESTEAEQFNG
jgi:isocitrate lyase